MKTFQERLGGSTKIGKQIGEKSEFIDVENSHAFPIRLKLAEGQRSPGES